VRASDQRREQTVAALRERALDGRLTLDAFASRVEAAYRAVDDEELGAAVADLDPQRGRVRGALARLFSRRRRIEVRLSRHMKAVTVGRSRNCDVVVGEETVSPVHAELRHSGDAWTVRDLESTNGTWLNGSRVREARLNRGDVLLLGGLRLDLRM
jgi:pSer/pThr/pTyr-binding forkhead associated (FHA) protein